METPHLCNFLWQVSLGWKLHSVSPRSLRCWGSTESVKILRTSSQKQFPQVSKVHKLLSLLGRVSRDHPRACTRQSLLWARGRDRKVPSAEGGYGYAVKLPTPALHPLAIQYSVSYICLAESCPHETGCISIAMQ